MNLDAGYITSSEQDSASPLTITRRCTAESMVPVTISIVLNCTLGREKRDEGLERIRL